MTMASYNEFNNNILRDTLIVSIGNCFSSVFAGFGVFSFLGHMAYRNCMNVTDVVKSGPGLAFIAYPEAMGLLPAPQLFSALFFIMLVLLGIDSQFAMVDVLVAAALDEYPHIFRKGHRKSMVVGVCCLLGFLLGIPILTNGGYHLFNLINDYSAYYGLLLLALSFSIVIHFVYNFTTTRFRFLRDIEDMIGRMNIVARVYFMSMWYCGTPAMILFIIIYAFIGYDTIAANYAGSYGTVLVDGIEVIASNLIYPDWTNVIAMLMSFSPFVPIFLYFIYAVIIYGKDAFKPLPTWKAANAKSQIEPFGDESPPEKQAASNPAFLSTAEESTADL